MNSDLLATFLILIFACVLLVWYSVSGTEGFTTEGAEGSRCGVNMAPCMDGMRCMNGYCASPNVPVLPPYSDIPVKPSDINDPGSFLHTE